MVFSIDLWSQCWVASGVRLIDSIQRVHNSMSNLKIADLIIGNGQWNLDDVVLDISNLVPPDINLGLICGNEIESISHVLHECPPTRMIRMHLVSGKDREVFFESVFKDSLELN